MRSVIALAAVATLLSSCAAVETAERPAAPAAVPAPAGARPHPLEGLWELRMERHLWWPYCVPGSLAVSSGPQGIHASVTFDSMWGIDPTPVTFEPADGDTIHFAVRYDDDNKEIVTGTVEDGVFVGRIEWTGAEPPETCVLTASRVESTRRFERDTMPGRFPIETDPAQVGVDPAALDRLILYAGRSDTDALVVLKDGKVVCDRTFLRPRSACDTEAITQVVASLAIPLLVEDQKIPRDLDTPLTTWFPQWKPDARKSRITLRHVLTQTTGLGYRTGSAGADLLADALEAAVLREPGTHFESSAQPMELLCGIIAKAAGEPADAYLERRLFRPLGIGLSEWNWSRDAAGNVPTYGGLRLVAGDLARVGSLVADRGRLDDVQIVPAWWFDEAATPSPVDDEAGLAWMLLRDRRTETVVQTQERLDRLKEAGVPEAGRLAPLVGRTFAGRRAWWKAVLELLGKADAEKLYERFPNGAVGGELRGAVACLHRETPSGQQLLVFPAQRLVVVRQRRPFAPDELPADTASRAGFPDLPRLAQDLLR